MGADSWNQLQPYTVHLVDDENKPAPGLKLAHLNKVPLFHVALSVSNLLNISEKQNG